MANCILATNVQNLAFVFREAAKFFFLMAVPGNGRAITKNKKIRRRFLETLFRLYQK